MSDLLNNISTATHICQNRSVLFKPRNNMFSTIYPFTTENISGYIDFFDLKDKSLLTVGSSGDQEINAISKGCKDITVVDINPYTKYYYYLKVASILELELAEMLNYLKRRNHPTQRQNNNNSFSIEIYQKIRKTLYHLDEESYLFWESLYRNKSPLTIRDSLFSSDEYNTSVIIASNPYMTSKEIYDQTRAKLHEIKPVFKTKDILNDPIQGQFDNIWLSNIAVYLDYDAIEKIVKKFYLLLKKQGNLLISYLYAFDKKTKHRFYWDPIYHLPTISDLLKEYKPYLEEFEGIDALINPKTNEKDSILLCKKM